MEKFPDMDPTTMMNDHFDSNNRSASPRKAMNGGGGFAYANGNGTTNLNGSAMLNGARWNPRRESLSRGVRWNGTAQQPSTSPYGHGRQKSLSDAIRTIRTRHGSVSQNAHEIADALKAPVSPKLIVRRAALISPLETRLTLTLAGSVYTVVHVVRAYKHVVEIHPQRL